MTPTAEQIEIVALAVASVQCTTGTIPMVIDEDRDVAREVFAVIAPMVLEVAARELERPLAADTVLDDYERMAAASLAGRVRAMK